MDEAFDINGWSAAWFALRKETPAKTWWDCEPIHKATYRALGVRPADCGAVYACAPFRIHRSEEGVRVLAAYPAPACFNPPSSNWLEIETVISWDPVRDVAAVVGDPSPQIVGHLTDDANGLYSSPLAFFQAWCQRRAQFAVLRQEAAKQPWQATPRERDETPGGLVIGATADIHWQPSILPETIQCVGINPTVVNRAIMRAARLPRALGGAS